MRTIHKGLTSFIILLLSFYSNTLYAGIRDSVITGTLLQVQYAYQIPGGDLSKRFGNNSNIGAGVLFKLEKNWLIGASGGFLFGGKVKEDTILNDITGASGVLFGQEGLPSNVELLHRGYEFHGKFGKIIPLIGPNPNSGIMLLGGVGFLEHKIRIQVNKDFNENTLPQLSNEFKKGYDRLTNGLSLSQFIGYVHLDNNKLVNFYFGVEFNQSFTKNRRTINYDTGMPDNTQRLDSFIGFRAGWIIPIYNDPTEEVFYY